MRGPIEIRSADWRHVQDGHVTGGANTKDKSVFYATEDVRGLVKRAEQHGVFKQRTAAGNYERVVNAGRPIGIDHRTGRPTAVYTVVTRPDNSLVTAFPGVHKRREGGLKGTFVESVEPPRHGPPRR